VVLAVLPAALWRELLTVHELLGDHVITLHARHLVRQVHVMQDGVDTLAEAVDALAHDPHRLPEPLATGNLEAERRPVALDGLDPERKVQGDLLQRLVVEWIECAEAGSIPGHHFVLGEAAPVFVRAAQRGF